MLQHQLLLFTLNLAFCQLDKYEIKVRLLLFLKRILDKKHDDPCVLAYNEMLKFQNEKNWTNIYNLALNDDNVKKMSVSHWEYFVKSATFKEAFLQL